jgi:hypothetical protein
MALPTHFRRRAWLMQPTGLATSGTGIPIRSTVRCRGAACGHRVGTPHRVPRCSSVNTAGPIAPRAATRATQTTSSVASGSVPPRVRQPRPPRLRPRRRRPRRPHRRLPRRPLVLPRHHFQLHRRQALQSLRHRPTNIAACLRFRTTLSRGLVWPQTRPCLSRVPTSLCFQSRLDAAREPTPALQIPRTPLKGGWDSTSPTFGPSSHRQHRTLCVWCSRSTNSVDINGFSTWRTHPTMGCTPWGLRYPHILCLGGT